MQRVLFLLVLTSIFANYCLCFSLLSRSLSVSTRVRKSLSLSEKPEKVITDKMSKNKVKAEAAEIDYDVIRSSGFVLQGTLTYPKDGSEKGPVIVFVHGTMSSKDHNFVPDVCKKMIADYGIRSYRFNSRFDKSESEPGHRYKFSGYEDDIDDLKTVITQLRKDGFTPFCLFGHSRGANDVLIYSSRFCKNGNNDSKEEDIEIVLENDLKINNDEGGKEENEEMKINMNLKLPKTTEEMQLEKNENEIKTPTSITANPSSVLLSDFNSEIEKLSMAKVAIILSEQEVEKEVVILKDSKSENGDEDNLHILDDEKLLIVVAAPRFHMPKMLMTLFTAEQIEKLESEEKKFEWQSSEKGDLYVTREDAEVVLSTLNMKTVISAIPGDVPILLLHGTDDELISLDDAKSYKEARSSIDLTVIEGARHAFRGKKQLKQFVTTVTDWIDAKYKTRF